MMGDKRCGTCKYYLYERRYFKDEKVSEGWSCWKGKRDCTGDNVKKTDGCEEWEAKDE